MSASRDGQVPTVCTRGRSPGAFIYCLRCGRLEKHSIPAALRCAAPPCLLLRRVATNASAVHAEQRSPPPMRPAVTGALLACFPWLCGKATAINIPFRRVRAPATQRNGAVTPPAADTTFGFANLDNTVYVGEIFVQGHNFSVRPSCTAQHCVRAAKTDICGTGTARHGQL